MFETRCVTCRKKIEVQGEATIAALQEKHRCLDCKGMLFSSADEVAVTAIESREAVKQFCPRLVGVGKGQPSVADKMARKAAERKWVEENRVKDGHETRGQKDVVTELGAGVLPAEQTRGRNRKSDAMGHVPADLMRKRSLEPKHLDPRVAAAHALTRAKEKEQHEARFGTPAALTTSPTKLDKLRQRCENELFFLAKEVIGWDADYLDELFHGEACALLDVWFRKYPRIIMHWPREHLKTSLITVTGSVQEIIRARAEIRIAIINAKADNASDMLRQIANIFKSNEIIQLLYPEIIPDFGNTIWRDDAILLKRRGKWKELTVEAFGAGSDITGRHYHLGILDDIVSFNNSRSKSDRDYIRAWYKQFLSVQGAEGRIWIPSTRYHNDDLYGHLKSTGNYAISFYTCFKGAALSGYPVYKRFSVEALERIKKEQGNFVFSCQYLNRAIPDEEMTFHEKHASKFKDLPENVTHYLLVDQVNPEVKKDSDTRDRAVVLDVAVCKDMHWYINDYVCKRMQPSELIETIVRMYWKYKPVRVGCGAVGYERIINHDIKEMERKRNIYIPFELVNIGVRSKPERIKALEPKWSRGEIHHRDWMQDFEDELFLYPGQTDDLLDSLALLPDVLVNLCGGEVDQSMDDYEYVPIDEVVNY